MGLINIAYDIPNLRIENPEAVAHTRIGWFRSVSNVPHAVCRAVVRGELAAAPAATTATICWSWSERLG